MISKLAQKLLRFGRQMLDLLCGFRCCIIHWEGGGLGAFGTATDPFRVGCGSKQWNGSWNGRSWHTILKLFDTERFLFTRKNVKRRVFWKKYHFPGDYAFFAEFPRILDPNSECDISDVWACLDVCFVEYMPVHLWNSKSENDIRYHTRTNANKSCFQFSMNTSMHKTHTKK